jgi:hypothetical protein
VLLHQAAESAAHHGIAVTDPGGRDALTGVALETTTVELTRYATLECSLGAVPSAESIVLAPFVDLTGALALGGHVTTWFGGLGAQTRTFVDPVGEPIESGEMIYTPATRITP